MTRRALVFCSLVGLAACSGEPSQPSEPAGGPAFAIVDASDPGGRGDFGWRPPIANTSIGGTFDATRAPTVRICVLAVTLAGEPIGCTTEQLGRTTVQVVAGNYHFDWTVPPGPALPGVKYYRIFVEEEVVPGAFVILGFADVKTAASSKGTKPNDPTDFVAITYGSILPIKFRITDACEDASCSNGFIDTNVGGTSYLTDEGGGTVGGITIDPVEGGGLVTVEITLCTDLPIDIPQFGLCISALVETAPGVEFVGPGLAFICDAETAVGGLSNVAQRKLVTLHRKHDADPVQALPHADDLCPTGALTTGSVKGLLRALARGNWKNAGRQLAGLIAPKPLYARRLDAGGGGGEVDGGFSDFRLALPCKAEKVSGDNQSAPQGSELPFDPTARCTDLFGIPVAGATLTFQGDGVSATPLLTPSGAGEVSVDWTIPNLGANVLTVSGRGIGGDDFNGPRGGGTGTTNVDPFQPFPFLEESGSSSGPVELKTGSVTFTATGLTPEPVSDGFFDFGSAGYSSKQIAATAASPAGWYLASFDAAAAGFTIGTSASFGFRAGCAPAATTLWSLGTDILVRKKFTLSEAQDIQIRIAVDNDLIDVYLNGVKLNAATIAHGGCAIPFGVDNTFFVVPAVAGINLIAIRAHDDGAVESFLDIKVSVPIT